MARKGQRVAGVAVPQGDDIREQGTPSGLLPTLRGDDMQPEKKYLIVINDAPYGDERPYNALRLALNLVKREGAKVRVFLLADAVFCARRGQKTPEGYYNIERMIKSIARRGAAAT